MANKLLIAIGDSFCRGDGADWHALAENLDWFEEAEQTCLQYFQGYSNDFGELQQKYINYRIDNPKLFRDFDINSNNWSSHLDVPVHNLGISGGGNSSSTQTLLYWIQQNLSTIKAYDVCVLINYNISNRFHTMSRWIQDDLETKEPIVPDPRGKSFSEYFKGHNIGSSDWVDSFLERYDFYECWEWDFCYNLFLAQTICDKYGISFCFTGPGHDTKLRDIAKQKESNYLDLPINWDRAVHNIIPEFTSLLHFTTYCNKNSSVNPLSACGHYNYIGQQQMGNHFNEKLQQNAD